MKTLILFLSSFLASGQVMQQGIVASAPPAIPCSPPTMTYRWPMWDSTKVSCGGTCTNGAKITAATDVVSANNLSQATTAKQPFWATGVINGLPSSQFIFASTLGNLTMTSGIQATGTATYYAVVKPTSGCATSTSCMIVAGTNVHGAYQHSFQWRIGTNQCIDSEAIAGPTCGTNPVSTTSFTTLAVTFNFSTGAYAFYQCTGGTCASDGSGTFSTTWGGFTDAIGHNSFNPTFSFDGYIPEVGYLNSISTTGIAAWSQCQFGV